MQKKLSRSVTATAFVVPAIFAGALIGPSPANAATTKSCTQGNWNRLVNQPPPPRPREENLLKGGGKKNGRPNASPDAQAHPLQAQNPDLQGQIAQINQQ